MRITILTLFPQAFDSFLAMPVTRRAIDKGRVRIEVVDIKEHAAGSFRKIDDSPCGGGRGMVMRVDTVKTALDAVRSADSHTIMFSPKGHRYTQERARRLAGMEDIVLLCGHYEGIDARVESYVDEQISMGDYVLTGGELPAMTVCDSIVRLLDDVLREGSPDDESFENGLLEYPQYTHPVEFDGMSVPDVLLGGNKALIDRWRIVESIRETIERRPDMIPEGRTEYGELVLETATWEFEDPWPEPECIENWGKFIPVKMVVFSERKGDRCFLLSEKIKGRPLSDPYFTENPGRLLRACVKALRTLWKADISAIEHEDGKVLSFNGAIDLDSIYADRNGITAFDDLGYLITIREKDADLKGLAASIKHHTKGRLGLADLKRLLS